MTDVVPPEETAIYAEAMRVFGDPVFARWLVRGYPYGGADLNRAHDGYLLARDGVEMSRGDVRMILNLLVRELVAIEHRVDHGEMVLAPTARKLRRLLIDVRRLVNAHGEPAEFRLRCPCSIGDGEFSGSHENASPPSD